MDTVAGSALAGLVVVVLFVFPLFLPVNLRMTASEDGLTIEFRGFDVLWMMRRTVRVPAADITSIRVVARADLSPGEVAPPGLSIPGIILAGSLTTDDGKELVDVRRGEELLTVYCRTGAPYHSLTFEFADPYAVLCRVQESLKR